MKDYNDPIINSAAEILSEATKGKSKLNFDNMTVAQIEKAIKQGKTTEKEVAAFYRNVQWDDLNESTEIKESTVLDKEVEILSDLTYRIEQLIRRKIGQHEIDLSAKELNQINGKLKTVLHTIENSVSANSYEGDL